MHKFKGAFTLNQSGSYGLCGLVWNLFKVVSASKWTLVWFNCVEANGNHMILAKLNHKTFRLMTYLSLSVASALGLFVKTSVLEDTANV